jgi:hypothetical protein
MFSTGVLSKTPGVSYTAAQALPGSYEITVRRVWGQPLGGRAFLEITENKGTPHESKRLEAVNLNQTALVKVVLKEGRRTALANVPPPGAPPRRETTRTETKSGSPISKLRELAHGDLSGATGPRGAAFTPGVSSTPSLPRRPQQERTVYQTAVAPMSGGGMDLTAQFRMSADRREASVVMRPVFQTLGTDRAPVNLSGIPGGANP